MQMPRVDLIKELRNPDYEGPMIHLRDWSEIQVLMHRAADLLQEAEEDAIVRDALAKPAQGIEP
jgi:hypothetical protein